MERALMTYDEVAAMFPGKSWRWVRDFLVAGRRVDAVRIGRDRFVVRASVARLIAQSTVHGFERVRLPARVARRELGGAAAGGAR